MHVVFTPYALPAVVSLLIKIVIYFYARATAIHNRQTRLYLLFLFSLSIQNLAEIVFLTGRAEGMPEPGSEGQLYFAASIVAVVLLLHLVLVSTRWADRKIHVSRLVLLYTPAIVLQTLLWGTTLFVAGFQPMNYTYTKIPGPLFFLWEAYVIGYFLIVLVLLISNIRKQQDVFRRLQNKLLLLGLSPFIALAIAIIVLQRFGFREFNSTATLPVAITFFLIVTAYAIHQHRLFDVEFFIPWSRVRKRKTLFYQRIQTLIAEVTQISSRQKILEALSDLFRCHVALVSGERVVVACSATVDFNASADNFRADAFAREALTNIRHFVVAREVKEDNPTLHQLMQRYHLGAVVPFNALNIAGNYWLVFGNGFNEQVYTSLDFKRVEALFRRVGNCLVQEFQSWRSAFVSAIESNDAEPREHVPAAAQQPDRADWAVHENSHRPQAQVSRLQTQPHKLFAKGIAAGVAAQHLPYIYAKCQSRIYGTGSYLPEERVTTQELLREIDSKNRFGIPYHWIERVSGIKEKRITRSGILPSDMAVAAAKEALERAGILPQQINAIIYTGLIRDYIEPATAHVVQEKLGAVNATVFDISNACHGFMNGLHVMDTMIASGQVQYGLIVTGEQGSLFAREAIDVLKESGSRDLFKALAANLTLGDAGGAIVLGPKKTPEGGFVGMMLQSMGQFTNLCVAGGPLTVGPLFTDMPRQLSEGAIPIKEMFEELMFQRLHWRVSDLAKCVIHQIGTRGLFRLHHELLGIPHAIMPKTVDVLGNLITANIPVILHDCVLNHELKAGDKVYLSGSGSGISISQAGVVWDIT
ncbi:MAG: 3-oxoacyl-[acyl-carrier-protein] synthase III C-terminal domain-containing protein [Sulfurifustis sp.]